MDHLQELTSRKDQAKYRSAAAVVSEQVPPQQPAKPTPFIGVRTFAEAFDRSPGGVARAEHLATPAVPAPQAIVVPSGGSAADGAGFAAVFATEPLVRRRYALSNWQMFRAMVQRDALLMSRNGFLYM